MQEHYEKVKMAISATPGQPDSAIRLINKDLGTSLLSTVTGYQNWLDAIVRGVCLFVVVRVCL